MRDRKEVDLNGKGCRGELGDVQGEETIIRIHCMRKELIFNKKEKRNVFCFQTLNLNQGR